MTMKDAAYYDAITSPTVEYPDDRTEIEQSDAAIGARHRAIDEGRLIPVPDDEAARLPDDPAGGGDNPSPCEGCGATATYNSKAPHVLESGILIVDQPVAVAGATVAGIGPANWVWSSPADAPVSTKLRLTIREVIITPVAGECVASNSGGCVEKDPCTFSVFIRFIATINGLISSWLPPIEVSDPTNPNFIAHLRNDWVETFPPSGDFIPAYSFAHYILEFTKAVSCGTDWEYLLGQITVGAGLGWVGDNQPGGGTTSQTQGQLGTTDNIQLVCAACS